MSEKAGARDQASYERVRAALAETKMPLMSEMGLDPFNAEHVRQWVEALQAALAQGKPALPPFGSTSPPAER